MSTEFGPTEQSRLAELLGEEYGMRVCRRCRGGEFKFDECWMCRGTGMSRPPIPTGLALIESCRKRGVQISVDTFSEGYEVECFQGGRFVFRMECQFTELESAISIAALKGLESVADPESAN